MSGWSLSEIQSMPHIGFSGTSDFRPFLPEVSQVCTGSYGFELALFLSQSLAAKGVFTSYPFCFPDHNRSGGPDWFIEYMLSRELVLKPDDRFVKSLHNGATFLIGVCSECNDEDGYSEEASQGILWHIDIEDNHPASVRAACTDYAPVKVKLAEMIIDVLDARSIKTECDWR